MHDNTTRAFQYNFIIEFVYIFHIALHKMHFNWKFFIFYDKLGTNPDMNV